VNKNILILLATSLVSVASLAQETNDEDSKRSNHYVGIQANQLIRQLLNFGGSSSVATNPYLLTYSVNSKHTGWGFTAGLGYTHTEVNSGDPLNPINSKINDFFLRVGFEKKTMIGKRWLFSSGIDVITESLKDKTVNNSQFGIFKIETSSRGIGLGPRVTLNYQISDRILVGTEASYYYKSSKQEQEINGSSQGDGDKLKQLTFSVPAVIYLFVKF
jgi:hypothetical protein